MSDHHLHRRSDLVSFWAYKTSVPCYSDAGSSPRTASVAADHDDPHELA